MSRNFLEEGSGGRIRCRNGCKRRDGGGIDGHVGVFLIQEGPLFRSIVGLVVDEAGIVVDFSHCNGVEMEGFLERIGIDLYKFKRWRK